MATLSLERLAHLGEMASRDPQFQEFGRRFRGDLAIGCGDQHCAFRIESGRVTGVSLGENPQAPIRITGDEASWQAIWQGLPGGVHRAWRHQMLRFDGDPHMVYGYWKMIWRLGDLMVAAGWGD